MPLDANESFTAVQIDRDFGGSFEPCVVSSADFSKYEFRLAVASHTALTDLEVAISQRKSGRILPLIFVGRDCSTENVHRTVVNFCADRTDIFRRDGPKRCVGASHILSLSIF